MSKLLLIVGLVVVVGAGAYMLSNKDGAALPAGETSENTQTTDTSIASLITSGRSVQCEFSDTEAGGTTEGTVYVANKQVRADFTRKETSGKTSEGHMIITGGTSYIWSSETPQGLKMKADIQEPGTTKPSSGTVQGSLDINKTTSYKCSSWSSSASQFTPPSDVEFVDLAALMQNALGGVKIKAPQQ